MQPGRLQTQHISATGIAQPSIALTLVGVPASGATLDHPFTAALQLTNGTDHPLGPLQVLSHPSLHATTKWTRSCALAA